MKPVMLVGHSPNAANDKPLDPTVKGSAGQRLFEMTGWSLADYNRYCDRMNTLPEGFEDMVRMQQRMRASRHALSPALSKRVVIFVGKGNAELYPWTLPAWGETRNYTATDSLWTWIPHTSGRCLHWNDPAQKLKLRQMFSVLLKTLKREEYVHSR